MQRVASWLALVLPVWLASSALAKPTVLGFALPARRSDAAAISTRVRTVSTAVAARLSADPSLEPAPLHIADLVDRAQALSNSADLDGAARAFDGAIAEGLRGIDHLADPGAFIGAHVSRVAIALARGEAGRVAELMDRVVRYDPHAMLAGDEQRPRMQALLDAAKRRAGERPALSAEDLGDACHLADVVIVARALSGGAVEYLRFDARDHRCHVVASATAGDGDSTAITALVATPLEGTPDTTGSAPRAPRRRFFATAIGLGVSALLLGAAGAGMAGWSHVEYDRLNAGCGQSGDCSPASAQTARNVSWAGFAVVGIAVTSGVTSLIVWLVARRSGASKPRAMLRLTAPQPSAQSGAQAQRSSSQETYSIGWR
jgi:hypothetical protein